MSKVKQHIQSVFDDLIYLVEDEFYTISGACKELGIDRRNLYTHMTLQQKLLLKMVKTAQSKGYKY